MKASYIALSLVLGGCATEPTTSGYWRVISDPQQDGEFVITATKVEDTVWLSWVNGRPPFQVQTRDASVPWTNYEMPTLRRNKPVPAIGSAWFRVQAEYPLLTNIGPALRWTIPELNMQETFDSFTVERSTVSNAGPWTEIASITDKTTIETTFTVPALNATVVIDVASSTWITVGHWINIAEIGTFEVISKDGTNVTVKYLEEVFSNVGAGKVVEPGRQVVPGSYDAAPPPSGTYWLRVTGVTSEQEYSYNVGPITVVPTQPGSTLFVDVLGSGGPDTCKAVAVAPNGSFMATGSFNANAIWTKIWDATHRVTKYDEWGPGSGLCAATDSQGNFYLGGSLLSFINFGGSVGALYGYGAFATAFIVKFNSSGVAQWGRSFPTGGDGSISGIAVDSSDNVYVTGAFTGDIDLGNGVKESSRGGQNGILLAKYSSLGAWLASKTFSTAQSGSGRNEGAAIAVGSDGSVWLTGLISCGGSGITFGGDTLTSNNASQDIFIAKFDSGLVHLYSDNFGDDGLDAGTSICATPDGGALVGGYFRGDLDLGGVSSPIANASSYNDGYVAKFSSALVCQWVKHYSGSAGAIDSVNALACHSNGSFVVGGTQSGAMNFGGNAGSLGSGYNDMFVAKYDSSGVCQWARVFGAISIDRTQGLAISANGTVYAAGEVYLSSTQTIDFGDGETRTGIAGGDCVVLKFAP